MTTAPKPRHLIDLGNTNWMMTDGSTAENIGLGLQYRQAVALERIGSLIHYENESRQRMQKRIDALNAQVRRLKAKLKARA